jgi:hypothetical protein
MDRRFFAVLCLTALAGCGGGGSSSPAPGGGPTPAPASVSGDMLALAASRGWNYHVTYAGTSLTVSLYDDPVVSNGLSALVVTVTSGLVPTVLTSAAAAQGSVAAGLGVTQSSGGYNAASEISKGGLAAIPGTPLFVGSTLTQGATSTPYPGVTETVTAVGSVPNANACPTPTTGATVNYTYSGSTYTVSFVPGCGMTQIVAPTGAAFNLISVGSYASIGSLSNARRLESATLADTARTVLGLQRNTFPAVDLFPAGFF